MNYPEPKTLEHALHCHTCQDNLYLYKDGHFQLERHKDMEAAEYFGHQEMAAFQENEE